MDTFGQGDYGGDTVLVGDGLAETLGVIAGLADYPDRARRLDGVRRHAGDAQGPTTVGGIFKSGVSQIDQSFVYMPIQQAQYSLAARDEWDVVEVKVAKPYDIAKTARPADRRRRQGRALRRLDGKECVPVGWP